MSNAALKPVVGFEDYFILGMHDAQKGVEHKPGMPEAYDRGYATQMESEAIASEATRRAGV